MEAGLLGAYFSPLHRPTHKRAVSFPSEEASRSYLLTLPSRVACLPNQNRRFPVPIFFYDMPNSIDGEHPYFASHRFDPYSIYSSPIF